MKKTFTPFVCAFFAQFFYFAFLTAQPTSTDNVNPIRVVVDHPFIDWEIDVTQSTFGGEINLADVPPTGILARTDDGVTEPTDGDTWTPVGWYGCLEPINGAELAGKIAFIGRGACQFGVKILNVEKHGAIGAIIGNRAPIGDPFGLGTGNHQHGLISMAPGTVGDSVTIPGVFMTFEDRQSLVALLDAEQELTITFEAPYIYNVAAAYSHITPLSQVVSLNHIQMVIINRDTLPLVDVALNASILEPDGNVVALQAINASWTTSDSTFNEAIAGAIDTIIPQRETGPAAGGGLLAGEYQIFFEGYTPSQAGEYTVTFSASTAAGNHPIDAEIETNTFVVSDGFSYSVGNGIISNPTGMSILPQIYADSFFVFNTGTVFHTGENSANVTVASFGLANPDELAQGLEFEAKIYNFDDTDDDGFGDSRGDELASATYVLTGAEAPNVPIFIEYDSPVSLDPNSTFLLMIEHVGFDFDNFTPPAYTTTGSLSQTVGFGTVYQLGAGFENGGFEYWNGGAPDWPYGGRQTMVGVHLEGFIITDVKETLADNKVKLSPNPTSGVLFLELALEDFADEVNIVFSNILGKRIRYEILEGVKTGTFEFRINDFTTGAYFMTVVTPEGFRTVKFVVVK